MKRDTHYEKPDPAMLPLHTAARVIINFNICILKGVFPYEDL